MPINVDYGPIAAAVQLGTQAGRGQYYQQQTENGDKFLSLMNDMQRTADQRKATAMQDALGYSELNAHTAQANAQLALASTQDAWQRQYQSGELGLRDKEIANQSLNYQNEAAYRNGMLQNRSDMNGIRQQNADTLANRADTYQQRVNDLEGTVKTNNSDKQALSALQAQVKASHDEWTGLQDSILSKHFGPTKRDDVPDADYAAAADKYNKAVAARDAKLQQMTAPPPPAAPAPGPGPMPGPGMQPMPMQGAAQSTPETRMGALQVAAAAVGVRPADVQQLPPPPQSVADRVKAFVMTQTSDPSQQRVVFYRLMIQAGLDPTKPAVQSQQPMAPGTAPLPMRGQ